MKNRKNKPKENNLKTINSTDITTVVTKGYIIAFKHFTSNELIFLANCADIKSICYSKHPTLPGTQNIKKAKVYQRLEDAKDDIYLLRYHHKQFLRVLIFAKQVLYIRAAHKIQKNDSQLIYYPLSDLMLR